MVLLLNAWAAVLVTLALATLVLQLLGVMAILGVKLSAVPAVLLVLAIGRGVHFTVHLCLVSGNLNIILLLSLPSLFPFKRKKCADVNLCSLLLEFLLLGFMLILI